MSIILIALSNSMEANVGQCSYVKHIWEKIQNIHGDQSHVVQDKDDDDHASSQANSHMEDSNNEEEDE